VEYQLTEEALDIINGRLGPWEQILFFQVVRDSIDNSHQDRLIAGEDIDLFRFSGWLKLRAEDLNESISGFHNGLIYTTSDDIGKVPGGPNIADRIVQPALQVSAIHEDAIFLSERVRTAILTTFDTESIQQDNPELTKVIDDINHNMVPPLNFFRENLVKYALEVADIIYHTAESMLRQLSDGADSIKMGIDIPDIQSLIDHTSALQKRFDDLSEELQQAGAFAHLREGYLYLLMNPSMEGLIKIGRTSRSPKTRANELSKATGVPTPFILVYDIQVEDMVEAEKYVHKALSPYRVSNGREFFKVDSSKAIEVMINARDSISKS
jgi:hypothetical protein